MITMLNAMLIVTWAPNLNSNDEVYMSTTMGNTTYYYGPNGAPAGSATRTGW